MGLSEYQLNALWMRNFPPDVNKTLRSRYYSVDDICRYTQRLLLSPVSRSTFCAPRVLSEKRPAEDGPVLWSETLSFALMFLLDLELGVLSATKGPSSALCRRWCVRVRSAVDSHAPHRQTWNQDRHGKCQDRKTSERLSSRQVEVCTALPNATCEWKSL